MANTLPPAADQPQQSSRRYAFATFLLDVTERRLERDGAAVGVPPRAFDVLVMLVERAGSLVSKDELMRQVWAGTTVEEANVGVAISTLRRIVGHDLIETVPKYGYRFAATVERTPTQPPGQSENVGSHPRWPVRLGATLVAALTVIVITFTSRRSGQEHTDIATARPSAAERVTISFARESHAAVAFDGRLAFTSDRDGDAEIYSADPDGAHPRRLTFHPGRDEFPSWSPDGRLIAFASERSGRGAQIYVMSADGSGVRAVTSLSRSCTTPSWSPDGQWIAFRRDDEPDIGGDIYTIRANGTTLRRLTAHGMSDVAPAWSPDGRTIAFASNRGGPSDFDLYLIDATGGEPRRITSGPGADLEPAWSPDGRQLAFVSNRSGLQPELYVLDVPDGLPRRVARMSAEHPSWSSDGATIVFTSAEPGNPELYRFTLDAAENLTHHEARDGFAAWSPDGAALVFTSNRDGKLALFHLAGRGAPVTKLTDGKANDWFPSWAPDGRRIAFQSDRAGQGLLDLCLMHVRSRTTRCITSGGGSKGSPAWSPDGKLIAFQSNMQGGPFDHRIYTIAPDGTGLTPMTSGPGFDGDPVWSPDGSRIAFTSTRVGGRFEVFTMRRDGGDVRQLTRSDGGAVHPWWSPDGRWIVYTGSYNARPDLYAVPLGGGGSLRLTYRTGTWPRWSPRQRRLIFTSTRQGNEDLFLLHLPEEVGAPVTVGQVSQASAPR